MRRPLTCRQLPSAAAGSPANRSPAWSRPACSNILSNTDFTPQRSSPSARQMRRRSPRQAGCMVKTDKRRQQHQFPHQIELAVHAADDKKAVDLTVLDLRNAAGFTDYFVICSGTNSRQVRAIADSVMESLAAEGVKPAHLEGYERSEWI